MKDRSKLPKWAQVEMEILERQRDEADNKLRRNNESLPDSDTWVYDPVKWIQRDEAPGYGLGTQPTILYRLTNDSEVQIRNEGKYLYVYCTGARTGNDSLLVSPQSSNVVRIMTGEWL